MAKESNIIFICLICVTLILGCTTDKDAGTSAQKTTVKTTQTTINTVSPKITPGEVENVGASTAKPADVCRKYEKDSPDFVACIHQVAIESKLKGVCRNIDTMPEEYKNCLDAVATAVMKISANPEEPIDCYAIRNQPKAFATCITNMAVQLGKPGTCKRLKEIETDKFYCWKAVAIKLQESDICVPIQNDKIRAECLAGIV